MLTVKDDGVNITLQSRVTPSPILGTVLGVGMMISVVAILVAIGWLSAILGAVIIVMMLVAGYSRHYFIPTTASNHLSDGQLRLTPHAFSYQASGKTLHYRLEPSDSVRPMLHGGSDTALSLGIYRADGKLLYQISGFSEPKHREIAQAILQGAAVKAQGKAIRMQSDHS